MEALPVLLPGNRSVHREWHAYFERVYGEPVGSAVDLNTFTWFYNFAPPHPARRVWPWPNGSVPPNAPWTKRTRSPVMNPETAMADDGFFVNRRLDDVPLGAGDRVEILRVSDMEFGLRWFYVVRGSGVFLSLPCDALRIPKPDLGVGLITDLRLPRHLTTAVTMMDWKDARLELVIRDARSWGVTSPCVAGLRYTTGWSRPVPLRCRDRTGRCTRLAALMALAAVLLWASNRPALSVAALVAAVALCMLRPRHAWFER
jgi:hypothetical protein